LRSRGREMPVLVLSARAQERDKVLALGVGADDYMTKPFSLAELLARINAALRRQRIATGGGRKPCFGNVEIDRAARLVWCAGEPQAFTAREFALLLYFVDHPGQVFGREQLLSAVWGYDYEGTARTVDNFVRNLRVKLEADAAAPVHFVTVHGSGYRFEG